MKYVLAAILIAVSLSAAAGYMYLDEKAYNSLLTEYVSAAVAGDQKTFEGKVRALRKFVHETIHPVAGEECRPDTVPLEKLVSGIGWCDQVSRVFMQLAKWQGITTRLLFLMTKDGTSPHTIAEALDGRRWVLVDAAYGLELVNARGGMATADDVRADPSVLTGNSRVAAFGEYSPIWKNPDYLGVYSNKPEYIFTKKGRAVGPMWFAPGPVKKMAMAVIRGAYFRKIKSGYSDPAAFDYFKARNFDLTGETGKACVLYAAVIRAASGTPLEDRARFFLALSLRAQKKYA